MSEKHVYLLLACLLGYGLIIWGFITFGASLERSVRILDIVVSCLIFTQFIQLTLTPIIRLDEPAHREVGMLGIHWFFVSVSTLLAIGLMVCGAAYSWSFNVQLLGQLLFLMVAFLGRYAALVAGEKVEQRYKAEQEILSKRK